MHSSLATSALSLGSHGTLCVRLSTCRCAIPQGPSLALLHAYTRRERRAFPLPLLHKLLVGEHAHVWALSGRDQQTLRLLRSISAGVDDVVGSRLDSPPVLLAYQKAILPKHIIATNAVVWGPLNSGIYSMLACGVSVRGVIV